MFGANESGTRFRMPLCSSVRVRLRLRGLPADEQGPGKRQLDVRSGREREVRFLVLPDEEPAGRADQSADSGGRVEDRLADDVAGNQSTDCRQHGMSSILLLLL